MAYLSKKTINHVGLLFIFAVAMANLESAVVVYLRFLSNPSGEFSFPIKIVYNMMSYIEMSREFATIVMLVVVGVLAVPKGSQKGWRRYAAFMILFGVWDIFYYVWLKIFINWPPSMATMDLLFLLPVPWVGPVYSPVMVSLAMILAGVLTVEALNRGGFVTSLSLTDWLLEALAIAVILLSYMIDYDTSYQGSMPGRYRWELLVIGLALGLFVYLRRLNWTQPGEEKTIL